MTEPLIFIRFRSHRARHYGLAALTRTPQGYWSLHRKTHPGGVYQVTQAEIRAMREYSDHAQCTRLKGPYDDLRECFNG